jgi:hypothetical protein
MIKSVGDSSADVGWTCEGHSFSFWMSLYLILKVGLLAWGVYLAIKTRNIPGSFNESKIIGLIVSSFDVTYIYTVTLTIIDGLSVNMNECIDL